MSRLRPTRRQLWLARSLGADLSRFDRPRVASRLTHLLHGMDQARRLASLRAQCLAVGASPDSTSIAELWERLAERLEVVELADEGDLLEIHSLGLVPDRAFSPGEAESLLAAADEWLVECPTCTQSFPRSNLCCPACAWPAFKSPVEVALGPPDPLLGVRWWEAQG